MPIASLCWIRAASSNGAHTTSWSSALAFTSGSTKCSSTYDGMVVAHTGFAHRQHVALAHRRPSRSARQHAATLVHLRLLAQPDFPDALLVSQTLEHQAARPRRGARQHQPGWRETGA